MGSACQLLNRNTCKPLRVHFEFSSLSYGGKRDTEGETARDRRQLGEKNLGFSSHLKQLQSQQQRESNWDNSNRDRKKNTRKVKRLWGLWLVGRMMGVYGLFKHCIHTLARSLHLKTPKPTPPPLLNFQMVWPGVLWIGSLWRQPGWRPEQHSFLMLFGSGRDHRRPLLSKDTHSVRAFCLSRSLSDC